jgi:hypothetical protein
MKLAIQTKGFLTSYEIETFYKQGYLLKKNCLSPKECEELNKDVTDVIVKALEKIEQSNTFSLTKEGQMDYVDGSRIVYNQHSDQSTSISRINGVCGMQPSLLNTLRSEKMIHTFFELLNTTDLEHLIAQLHPKIPGDGVAFPKHRDIQYRKAFDPDWQDVQGNGSYAICIIPIDAMNQENGGIWVDRNNYPDLQEAEEDRAWVDAEPGDLLFMHPYLSHGSGPNLSKTSRRTLLTGFCAYGANHKTYPGAHVNVHVKLMENGSVAYFPLAWNQTAPNKTEPNH